MSDKDLICSFCSLSKAQTNLLVAGQDAHICDSCIEQAYGIIISTNAGLWRYKIGDTVKFTSLNPFRIKITGRTKSKGSIGERKKFQCKNQG